MRSCVRGSALTLAATVVLLACSTAAWSQQEGLLGHIRELEARETAIEGYIFGYPLVTMEMTRRLMTNVAAPEGTRAGTWKIPRVREVS